MHIPIIIVNWNGFSDTRECVQSVLKMRHEDFRIFLLDNGSEGDDAVKLESMFRHEARVQVIRSESNLGFAKGNNWVLKNLIDPLVKYVALLNNDTVVDEDWLSELIDAAEKNEADVISSKLINYYDRTKLDNVGHQMLTTGEVIPIGHHKSADHYVQTMENWGSCAAGTLYSMQMVKHLGFFDDHFSTGYEDAEIGARAYIAGYRCIYAPQARVFHKVGQSIGKVFDQSYPAMIQSYIWYTYFKLLPFPVIALTLPLIVLKSIFVMILNILFLRPKYIRIMTHGWKKTFLDWSKIKEERRKYFGKVTTRSSFVILRHQTFFLGYDIQRFFRVFIEKKGSAFDSYGNS